MSFRRPDITAAQFQGMVDRSRFACKEIIFLFFVFTVMCKSCHRFAFRCRNRRKSRLRRQSIRRNRETWWESEEEMAAGLCQQRSARGQRNSCAKDEREFCDSARPYPATEYNTRRDDFEFKAASHSSGMFELQRAHWAICRTPVAYLDPPWNFGDGNIGRGFVPVVVRSRWNFGYMTILIGASLGEAV